MLGILEQYCPKCGYRIRIHEEKFCHGCGIPIKQPEQVHLTDEDVKDIPIIEKTAMDEIKDENLHGHKKEFWLTGSYYLVAFSNILTIGLVEAGKMSALYLPIVLSSSLLMSAFFGAAHLRHVRTHNGASFSQLMGIALKKFIASIVTSQARQHSSF